VLPILLNMVKLTTLWVNSISVNHDALAKKTRIPNGIWSCHYGWIVTTWLFWICVLRTGRFLWALNTWSKVWPWILISAYLIWNFALIFSQQISILNPPYIGLFGPSWSELSPNGWIVGRGGGVGSAGDIFFCHGRTETWLLKSRLAACERRD